MSRKPLKINNIFLLTLVLFCWAWASILWSVNPNASLSRFINLTLLISFYFLIINLIDSRKELNGLLASYVFGCSISGLLAIKTFFLSGFTSDIHGRMSLMGQNPNTLGGLMGLALLFSFYLLSEVKNSLCKLITLVFLIIFLYVLVMAQSRTAWVAFTLASAIFFLNIMKMNPKLLLKFSLCTLLMVIFFFCIVYLSPQSTILQERFSSLSQMETAGRTDIWKTGFEMWKDNPILGVGLNNFKVSFEQYLGFSSFGLTRYTGSHRDPHNVYLCIVCELGLLGFAIFSAMLYCCFRTIMKYDLTLKAFTASIFIFTLVVGLAGTNIWSKPYWLILGLIGAGLNFANQSDDQFSTQNSLQ